MLAPDFIPAEVGVPVAVVLCVVWIGLELRATKGKR